MYFLKYHLKKRLLELAPHYYDLSNFPNCEAKRVLERLQYRASSNMGGMLERFSKFSVSSV
jgi:hypothetical protein